MIAPALQRLLQVLTPASAAEIDQTFRALRAQELVPTSPRGRGVPPVEMTPEHAAWALLALTINRPAAVAAEVVRDWGAMRPTDGSSGIGDFADTMIGALSDPGAHMQVREIRICREWPRALVVRSHKSEVAFGFDSAAEAKAAGYRTTVCRSEFVISGSALHQIAIDLASLDGGMFGGTGYLVDGDVS